MNVERLRQYKLFMIVVGLAAVAAFWEPSEKPKTPDTERKNSHALVLSELYSGGEEWSRAAAINRLKQGDIEGANPLYLPQAKVYRNACALGPALVVMDEISLDTEVAISISRDGAVVFQGSTNLHQLKRSFDELADYLFRENIFPHGAFLMTGTGVVPANDFTLRSGDAIRIRIDGLGVLENTVE